MLHQLKFFTKNNSIKSFCFRFSKTLWYGIASTPRQKNQMFIKLAVIRRSMKRVSDPVHFSLHPDNTISFEKNVKAMEEPLVTLCLFDLPEIQTPNLPFQRRTRLRLTKRPMHFDYVRMPKPCNFFMVFTLNNNHAYIASQRNLWN